MQNHPYIITVSSEKGGVGKTTLATNLAIYLKAMREDLPVTVFSFDNHFTIDLMFEIPGGESGGTVRELLTGEPASGLARLGQYGVSYIPSSGELEELYGRFSEPLTLKRMLAESGVDGIVIIDTRPDLNALTRGALYAADRVLIPVKDLPSIQNCRHIFALFDRHGIEKKSLALLPCLIDERIKFDGALRDQKTLLRTFAAERGYRCLDNHISKSPKVESLGTNPDGKIYPILTHARGTEVYRQYAQVTREVLQEFDEALEKEEKLREARLTLTSALAERCLICGEPLAERPEHCGFYYESSDRAQRGFLHDDCFADMLCGALYGIYDHSQALGAARTMIAKKAGSSVSFFLPRLQGSGYLLDFRQFNPAGESLFRQQMKLIGFAEGEQNTLQDRLHLLLNHSLAGSAGSLREGSWLAVHPVDPAHPEEILVGDSYRQLQQLQAKILHGLGNRGGLS